MRLGTINRWQSFRRSCWIRVLCLVWSLKTDATMSFKSQLQYHSSFFCLLDVWWCVHLERESFVANCLNDCIDSHNQDRADLSSGPTHCNVNKAAYTWREPLLGSWFTQLLPKDHWQLTEFLLPAEKKQSPEPRCVTDRNIRESRSRTMNISAQLSKSSVTFKVCTVYSTK